MNVIVFYELYISYVCNLRFIHKHKSIMYISYTNITTSKDFFFICFYINELRK